MVDIGKRGASESDQPLIFASGLVFATSPVNDHWGVNGMKCLALAAVLAASSTAQAGTRYETDYHSAGFEQVRYRCTGCARDTHDRIMRDRSSVRQFKRQTGYPHGRKGYVVDHIVPLKRGGCDCASNMQWQTKEQAKAKDRYE